MNGRQAVAALGLLALACGREPAETTWAARPMPSPDGRPALLVDHPLSDRIASYRIEARLDVAARRVAGRARLTWRNGGRAPVAEIPLHLYMNAFKNEGTRFLRRGGMRGGSGGAPTRPGEWGWIEVASIMDGADDLRPAARHAPDDETILTVPLRRPIPPGGALVLDMTFTTQLPRVVARTGWQGDFFMIAQWFPKIGVLEADDAGQRWQAAPFDANNEFFADFGTYDVVLTVPDTHTIAATGVLTAAAAADPGFRTLTYHAEDVHDFAWMADPHMKLLAGTVKAAAGEVEVRVYYRPGHEAFAPRYLAAARRTIEMFSATFVPYPWPIMTLVDPPLDAVRGAGGMEYPTLVTVGADIDVSGVYLAEEVAVHEVAHNWFQGMLASNEVEEPFLDEGLTEFTTGLVMDDLFGPDRSMVDTRFLRLGYYDIRRAFDSGALASPIATPAYATAPGEYGAAIYRKTSQALKTLEGMFGKARLLDALGRYARLHAFKHPHREDLFRALSEGLGEDLGWFLEPAFMQAGSVDFRVGRILTRRLGTPRGIDGEGAARRVISEEATGGGWHSEVAITRPGRIPARVTIAMRFSDGKTIFEEWDGRGFLRRFSYDREAPLVGVEIDPQGKLALENEVIDDAVGPRDVGADTRAAARAGFWLQTAAGMVGL